MRLQFYSWGKRLARMQSCVVVDWTAVTMETARGHLDSQKQAPSFSSLSAWEMGLWRPKLFNPPKSKRIANAIHVALSWFWNLQEWNKMQMLTEPVHTLVFDCKEQLKLVMGRMGAREVCARLWRGQMNNSRDWPYGRKWLNNQKGHGKSRAVRRESVSRRKRLTGQELQEVK